MDKEQIFTAHNDYLYSTSHKQYVLSGRVGTIVSSYFVAVLHLQQKSFGLIIYVFICLQKKTHSIKKLILNVPSVLK